MNVKAIQKQIQKIEELSMNDSEASHAEEDWLYLKVLRAIARGAPNARDLAREALKTQKLGLVRYYG